MRGGNRRRRNINCKEIKGEEGDGRGQNERMSNGKREEKRGTKDEIERIVKESGMRKNDEKKREKGKAKEKIKKEN